jgi:hypothetical protein
MLRSFTAFFVAGALLLSVVPSSEAAGYCPSRPGGKCPEKRQENKKSRSEFSPEQLKKNMAEARKLCARKYGVSASFYRYDWSTQTVRCTSPGRIGLNPLPFHFQ